MCLCIYVLSYQLFYISYLLHFLSLHKSLVYPPFIFCMMNVVRIWQGNMVLQNISDVTQGVHWVQLYHPQEKSCPFQKEYKKEIFHLVFRHFNFWPAIEKCYYLPISIVQNKSFKDICSIGMSYAVVWFHRAHLQKQPP